MTHTPRDLAIFAAAMLLLIVLLVFTAGRAERRDCLTEFGPTGYPVAWSATKGCRIYNSHGQWISADVFREVGGEREVMP